MSDIPIAFGAWEQLADAYAAMVDDKAHNAHYERPAMLGLMPAVKGMRALDAGCGSGRYAEWLVDQGAEVTAFDVNPAMLKHASARLGGRARIELADLNQPLALLEDGSFDLVVCALAMDYVRDWRAVFREFHRVLSYGGCFVYSFEHPLSDYSLRLARNYFETEHVEATWSGFGQPVVVPYIRRPLSEVFNSLSDAGFSVERVVEPLPTEEFRHQNPKEYEALMGRPCFLCVRARRM